MKTTLDLHDSLLNEAKAFAARQSMSLTRLIEEGLRMRIKADNVVPPTKRRAMPVFKPSVARAGLKPGLSGLSAREMLDALDDAA